MPVRPVATSSRIDVRWEQAALGGSMFEKYTEKARRVIFFARYECSADGSPTIESHHLLIGLMRESSGLLALYLDSLASQGEIRAEISKLTTTQEPRPPIPTSVDLPLSEECQRILAFAAEEAERLGHLHVGTEHLLLGILREENCLAAKVLRERGVSLEHVREVMVASENEGAVKRGLGSGGG